MVEQKASQEIEGKVYVCMDGEHSSNGLARHSEVSCSINITIKQYTGGTLLQHHSS